MKKFYFTKIFVIYFLLVSSSIAVQSDYLKEGIMLYDKKKIEESKILFERDIVFNPESEKSYLYLAKIFYEKENDEEQEVNLNNVLLLNPKNDEAIYMLAILKIKQSDYSKAKELIDQFDLICRTFCDKRKEIIEKFSELTPENDQTKN